MNDGKGVFTPAQNSPFATEPSGSVFDIEVFDANGDGLGSSRKPAGGSSGPPRSSTNDWLFGEDRP